MNNYIGERVRSMCLEVPCFFGHPKIGPTLKGCFAIALDTALKAKFGWGLHPDADVDERAEFAAEYGDSFDNEETWRVELFHLVSEPTGFPVPRAVSYRLSSANGDKDISAQSPPIEEPTVF
jgi:hypothetical protein